MAPEGIGLLYSSWRGDALRAAGYGTGLLIVGTGSLASGGTINFGGAKIAGITRQGTAIAADNVDDIVRLATVRNNPNLFPAGTENLRGNALREAVENGLKGTAQATNVADDLLIASLSREMGIPLRRVTNNSLLSKAKQWQGRGNYPGIDEWIVVEIPKGTRVYGGRPGQSEFYSIVQKLDNVSAESYWRSLQVKADDALGYRNIIGEYEVTRDIHLTAKQTSIVYKSLNWLDISRLCI